MTEVTLTEDILGFLVFAGIVSLLFWADMRDQKKWDRWEADRQRAKKYLPCPYKRP